MKLRHLIVGAVLGAGMFPSSTAPATPSTPTRIYVEDSMRGLTGTSKAGYEDYFGEGIIFHEHEDVQYDSLLESLWDTKQDLVEHDIHEFSQDIVEGYTVTPTTLTAYLDNAEQHYTELTEAVDWNMYQSHFNLSEKETEHIASFMGKIEGEMLGAYMLTELFPGYSLSHAEKNVEALDVLLRQAGSDFVERIPSQGDKLISFGPFQITRYLVGQEPEGDANTFNRYLPDSMHVPDKLEDVRGDQHFTAVYGSTAMNYARIVRESGVQEVSDTVALLSGLNHAPTTARIAIRNGRPIEEAVPSDYVRRTRTNYKALTNERRQKPGQPRLFLEENNRYKVHTAIDNDVDKVLRLYEEEFNKSAHPFSIKDEEGNIWSGSGPMYIRVHK